MLTAVVFVAMLLASASGFLKTSSVASRRSLLPLMDAPAATTKGDDIDTIRRWYTLSYQKRPEVSFANTVTTQPELVREMYKNVLVSLRVLKKDVDTAEHLTVTVIPNYPLGDVDKTLSDLQAIASAVTEDVTSPIFQPNFHRNVEVILMPSPPAFVFVVDTKRTKPAVPDFDDMDDELPFIGDTKEKQAIWTNEIKTFPFPTLSDFINEITRPTDPLTLSELKFNYKVKDLKYDLAKMSKKTNPAEFVQGLNVKLTRLQKWKDVLNTPDESEPNPFVDSVAWSEQVKWKYRSLKTLIKTDINKVIETQYDKRAYFIKFIDAWADRLKRSFRFTYFARSSPPMDFQKAFLEAPWRLEVANTTHLLAESPFLDFKGPSFTPGAPAPLFDDNRGSPFGSSESAEIVVYEMLAWLKKKETVESFASLSTNAAVLHHVYSRGKTTEIAMYDLWQGIAHWSLSHGQGSSKEEGVPEPFAATTLLSSLSVAKPKYLLPSGSTNTDHTDDFLLALRGINKIAREKSVDESLSVKEVFRRKFFEGKELTDWWGTLVRDLDLQDEMEEKSSRRKEKRSPWSEVMENVCLERSAPGGFLTDSGLDSTTTARLAEENAEIWKNRFKPTMTLAETIESFLPWKTTDLQETYSLQALAKFGVHNQVLGNETVILDFERESSQGDPSLLFVAPRYFRGGILTSLELSGFLEFARLVSEQLNNPLFVGHNFDTTKHRIDVLALHPQMVTLDQILPDFAKRAPHPALLLVLRKM